MVIISRKITLHASFHPLLPAGRHIRVHPQDQIELDTQGYVKVRAGTPETNVEGVFAAGDVQDTEWRQVGAQLPTPGAVLHGVLF